MQTAETSWDWKRECADAPLFPVVAIDDPGRAVGLARALAAGGVRFVELTLRKPGAIDCLAAIAKSVPEVVVGMGTVTRASELHVLRNAGCRFVVTPGSTPELLEAVMQSGMPALPGIATVSEAIRARDAGFDAVKVFPAAVLGGPDFLRAIAPVLAGLHFCPTGGVGAENYVEYLGCPRVFAAGASWPCKANLIEREDWAEVTRRASVMLESARSN